MIYWSRIYFPHIHDVDPYRGDGPPCYQCKNVQLCVYLWVQRECVFCNYLFTVGTEGGDYLDVVVVLMLPPWNYCLKGIMLNKNAIEPIFLLIQSHPSNNPRNLVVVLLSDCWIHVDVVFWGILASIFVWLCFVDVFWPRMFKIKLLLVCMFVFLGWFFSDH